MAKGLYNQRNMNMNDITNLHIRLTRATHRKFASVCAGRGIKMSDIVREAIDEFLKKNEGELDE